MCDEEYDYGQLLEEYRGLVESIIDSLIEKVVNTKVELMILKFEKAREEEKKQIDEMMKAVSKS